MPLTKKEHLYFTLMMCTAMVLGMTTYNLVINELLGVLSIGAILTQFLLGFMLALGLEWFIVGPTVKRVSVAVPMIQRKKLLMILFRPVLMVSGMVLCMSLFGTVTQFMIAGQLSQGFMATYLTIALKNVLFALPLQLLLVGPLVRFGFGKLFPRPIEGV